MRFLNSMTTVFQLPGKIAGLCKNLSDGSLTTKKEGAKTPSFQTNLSVPSFLSILSVPSGKSGSDARLPLIFRTEFINGNGVVWLSCF